MHLGACKCMLRMHGGACTCMLAAEWYQALSEQVDWLVGWCSGRSVFPGACASGCGPSAPANESMVHPKSTYRNNSRKVSIHVWRCCKLAMVAFAHARWCLHMYGGTCTCMVALEHVDACTCMTARAYACWRLHMHATHARWRLRMHASEWYLPFSEQVNRLVGGVVGWFCLAHVLLFVGPQRLLMNQSSIHKTCPPQ